MMPFGRKPRSIFHIIVVFLLAVLALDVMLIVGSIRISGVNEQLDQYAADILDKQVENRKGYLENSMIGTWSQLGYLAGNINATTQRMLDEGTISLEELNESGEGTISLLREISEDLISNLYSKRLSGIFVVLNTDDLDQVQDQVRRPGIHIRDMDPLSTPSYRRMDLLLERAPIQLVQELGISTDILWKPLFLCDRSRWDHGFVYPPFQAAFREKGPKEAPDYGYWTTYPYVFQEDTSSAISYSMPLILEDGTVYGVLGVELLTAYLQTQMPQSELHSSGEGVYVLGSIVENEEGISLRIAADSKGKIEQIGIDGLIPLQKTEGGYTAWIDGEPYYVTMQKISLYSRNAPFSSDQWVLAGMVQTRQLFSFSQQVRKTLYTAVALTLLIGILGSILISQRLTRPIMRLSDEVKKHRRKQEMPDFPVTGIQEIDEFSSAIADLSREVLDTSTKFLRIMEMSSVEMGGYELREDLDTVYVTSNFFSMLGIDQVNPDTLSPAKFRELLRNLDKNCEMTKPAENVKLYRVMLAGGGLRYLRVQEDHLGQRHVGVLEDVTAATMERLRIEHERDYDALTGLYSRRAFQRECAPLFEKPEILKQAALLMIDLDNLKQVNDTFGHDWGDQYIRQAGHCMQEHTPPGTLSARVSGDEFFLLFYGYDDKEQIREALALLGEAIHEHMLDLPSGRKFPISASGGIAWYPDDGTKLNVLMKYADFAMYQIKKSHKGEMGEFDVGAYNREAYENQTKKEFQQLLAEELLTYHFQPIVSGVTGKPVAYEALMRVDMPTLHTPDAVLRVAKEMGCLHEIERITLFKSVETFLFLAEHGHVDEEVLLFVNSIASECMNPEEVEEFCRRFSPVQSRLVVEITEAEFMNIDALNAKRETPGFSGMFALDDYGSGYNTEKNLLELTPSFIKVDISIIRDIDADPDKQQILSNIVSYAHRRGMKIIAEGLETPAEIVTVLELGADLLQGYYLGRPAAIPGRINPEAVALIERRNGENEKEQ